MRFKLKFTHNPSLGLMSFNDYIFIYVKTVWKETGNIDDFIKLFSVTVAHEYLHLSVNRVMWEEYAEGEEKIITSIEEWCLL